jgi:predicted SAM-dependent methyltransferase
MHHQRTKDLYFAALRPLIKLNYWRWRMQGQRPNGSGELHLHLACGTKYLPGFVNIDGNIFRRVDMWLDLRNGLPFPDDSVDSIYSCHAFEHFYPDELESLLRECHRVLRPTAGMRAVVPDMEGAVQAYLEGRRDYFTDFPRALHSMGGMLSNLLFCNGNHRQGFDFSHMEEVLGHAGFSEIWKSSAGRTCLYPPEKIGLIRQEEACAPAYSLFLEARR